jgi:formylglycine-generating enzyme required for sulfatase activity
VSLELVPILPGTFVMGSAKGYPNEKPAHPVILTQPFYMGRTEVTQEQWSRLMDGNPSRFKDRGTNLPVENLSWYAAREFTRRLTARAGMTVSQTASGPVTNRLAFALPTEAEWEYACRAGSAAEYAFGDRAGELPDYGWSSQNADNVTHPVAQKKPNAWGLHDMHGNVWEWAEAWLGPYEPGAVTNPTAAASISNCVIRGGSWSLGPDTCRSAIRVRSEANHTSPNIGLRVVARPSP